MNDRHETRRRAPTMMALAVTVWVAAGCAPEPMDGPGTLTISAGLSRTHFWVGGHMDPFADAIEASTDLAFTRFYAGELVTVGGELDALQSGVIDVAAPLLAPYHEGRFPLSDVTQLPTYGTSSRSITRAFQELMTSEVEVAPGRTFYDYEIRSKGLVAWGLGATGAYALSTTGTALRHPDDLRGMPIRAGSALHTIVLERLGVTPVTMPAAQAYEALSRGTLDGVILSVGDWISYSMDELLTFSVTGLAIGHWQSYLAVTEDTWRGLTDDQRASWQQAAADVRTRNADLIDEREGAVEAEAAADGARFVPVDALPRDMQDHLAAAATGTWTQWIERTERDGHPARATATLWAQLVVAQGGELPSGVREYLGLDGDRP